MIKFNQSKLNVKRRLKSAEHSGHLILFQVGVDTF